MLVYRVVHCDCADATSLVRYSEAIDEVYKQHTFNFWNTHPVFQHFVATTVSHRLKSVRSIQVEWTIYPMLLGQQSSVFGKSNVNAKEDYDGFWEAIASMHGLKSVRVWLRHSRMDRDTWENEETLWIEPIRTVTKPDLFEVALPVNPSWVKGDAGAARLITDSMQRQ